MILSFFARSRGLFQGRKQSDAGAVTMSRVLHRGIELRVFNSCETLDMEDAAASLREAVTQLRTSPNKKRKAQEILLGMRSSHTALFNKLHDAKERTRLANAQIDNAQLQLQNLQYERNHYHRQIKHLKAFDDKQNSIHLVDEEDFFKSAPPELQCITKADDPHQFHLNRLEYELQQRTALCEKRDVCLKRRSTLAKASGEKQAVLDGLASNIHSLITLSMPLQERLGHRLSRSWNERRPMSLLPSNLRTIYYRISAFRDAFEPTMELTVVGDYAAAERLISLDGSSPLIQKRKLTGSKSDEAEEDVEPSFHLRRHPLEVCVSWRHTSHPSSKAVQEEIDKRDEEGEVRVGTSMASLKIHFCCIPSIGLTGAFVFGQSDGFLVNLFDGDTGQVLPETCKRADIDTAEIIESMLPARPFAWVQKLSDEEGQTLGSVPIRSLFAAINSRAASRNSLANQLSYLSSAEATMPSSSTLDGLPLSTPITQITQWQEINRAQDLSASFREHLLCEPSWRCCAQRIFTFEAEYRAQVVLSVTVQIFADFPTSLPFFSAQWLRPPQGIAVRTRKNLPSKLLSLAHPAALRLAHVHAVEATDNGLVQMLSVINEPPEKIVTNGAIPLLAWTIHRLRVLLDVYMATEGNEHVAAACNASCRRRVRGRERLKPFAFNVEDNEFYHQ